jgi:Spy/CpxP family protein refolding chaperone
MPRRFVACLTVAAMATLLLATVAEAQRQGGRRGGGLGRGGFGGAQDVFSLVRQEPVQESLGLNEEQIAKAEEVSDAQREEARTAREDIGFNFQDLQDASPEERREKMEEFQAKLAEINTTLDAKFEPQLAEAIGADKMKRLNEIRIQAAGPAIFRDAKVVAALELTEEQQQQIAQLEQEANEQRREAFQGGFDEGAREQLQEISNELDTKIAAVMTPAQTQKFAQMKGEPFDVAQLRGRGFGGRGGREGGRRGGRGGNDN